MSKTPYEVRLDVLKMAQDMLESEQRLKEIAFKEKLDSLRSHHHSPGILQSFIDENMPKPYTEDQVIARSNTLYDFVSSSSASTKPKIKG